MESGIGHDGLRIGFGAVKLSKGIADLAGGLNDHVAGPLTAHGAAHPARVNARWRGPTFDGVGQMRAVGLWIAALGPIGAFAPFAKGDPCRGGR